MQIQLDQVIPAPLAGQLPPDSIWQGLHEMCSPCRYLVKAYSGRGKSTLVNLLYGIRHDYTGTVRFDGRELTSYSLKEWAALRRNTLSIVFQDMGLFPTLTARQNIAVKQKLGSALTQREIEGMAEALGIAHKLDTPCRLLSMGQQQRIAIIRALVQPFKFLLMDEPFSHLDAENTRLALELIQARCQAEGAGLLITSLGDHHGLQYDKVFTV